MDVSSLTLAALANPAPPFFSGSMMNTKPKQHSGRVPLHPLVAELDAERTRRGMTVAELAAFIHASERTVESWFYNGRNPSLRTFERIANQLGFDLILRPKDHVPISFE